MSAVVSQIPRLFLWLDALHPIRRQCTPSDRVYRPVTGAAAFALLFRPGCFVLPWAAARPRAVRAASVARRVVSKPGQAPPPPTGAAEVVLMM